MSSRVARTIDVQIQPSLEWYLAEQIERARGSESQQSKMRAELASMKPCLRERFEAATPLVIESLLGPITPVLIPAGRAETTYFLSRALPGHAVEHLGRPSMIALSAHERWEAPTSLFFQSLALCFAYHYPLALRPEVIGYLINHEVAMTVKRHPEDYRDLYATQAAGKVDIEVRDDTLVRGRPSEWGRALALFEGALRAIVPDGIMDATLPRYSTQTPESRVASLIAFMDAASPFYEYTVQSLCGIPRVRLLGTVDDWRLLLASVRKLAERFHTHLGPYFEHLLPVLKKIADQADPAVPVDNDFWASIYKYQSASGGDLVTGWATALVHYLKNPDGTLVPKDPRLADWSWQPEDPDERHWHGVRNDHFPMHLSTVPFNWKYLDEELPMTLVGGVLGVDDDDGFVTPVLSYAVVHARPDATAGTTEEPPPVRPISAR